MCHCVTNGRAARLAGPESSQDACLRAQTSGHGLDELLSLHLEAEAQTRALLGSDLLTQGERSGALGTLGLLQTWPAVSGPLRTSHLHLEPQEQQASRVVPMRSPGSRRQCPMQCLLFSLKPKAAA